MEQFRWRYQCADFIEPEEALPPENALKEMAEEIGYTGAIEMIPSFTYRSPSFTAGFIGVVDRESDVPLNRFNWEFPNCGGLP